MRAHSSIFVLPLLVVAIFANAATSVRDRFDNYRLFGLQVSTAEQLGALQQIEQLALDGYALWNEVRMGGEVDLMVAPHRLGDFDAMAKRLQFTYSLKNDNVQSMIDNEQPSSIARASNSSTHDWTTYQTYEQINAWLDQQLAAHSDVLTELPFGTSHEGRPIRAFRLSRKPGNPAIIVEANIHAREWITSATATWLLHELLNSVDPAVRDLSENVDWLFVPVFNADGFVYTHNVNRLWRKTRRGHSHLCYGADLNRNFDFHWMESDGASQNPCSETYAGPEPASDVETQHMVRFVRAHAAQTRIYLAFHSYSQVVIFPYGHTKEEAPNHAQLQRIGQSMADAFAKRNGTVYRAGATASVMYYSSGQSSDWAYGTQNIPLTYTLEFRDRGQYGFLLPADQIVPNALETLDALIALVAEARRDNVL